MSSADPASDIGRVVSTVVGDGADRWRGRGCGLGGGGRWLGGGGRRRGRGFGRGAVAFARRRTASRGSPPRRPWPAAGDPTAVVRARVTLGFGLAAGLAGVAGLVVGSGRGVWSAMRLA